MLERATTVADGVVKSEAAVVDDDWRWPEHGIRALQEAGLAGLVVPTSYGGLGYGMFALARVCEILGERCSSTGLCFGMHCVGSAVIAAKATPDHAAYLESISRGEHLTTLALSEPGTGAHFYYPQTVLESVGSDLLRLNGCKSFVTNGGRADSYVISTVAADPSSPPGDFSCVIVRGDSKGMDWGPEWSGIGMRGNSSRTVTLNNVEVACADLLGKEGDQIWYVFNVIAPYFLMAMAGCYLGISTAALDVARVHLTSRRHTHSGATLDQVGVLQHRLGTLWGIVERTRRLIYYASSHADAGRDDALPALFAAKVEAADCAVTVVNEAMTLTGGVSYEAGNKLGRLLRDARAAHVMAPTTDILRTWIARSLLDQPILGE